MKTYLEDDCLKKSFKTEIDLVQIGMRDSEQPPQHLSHIHCGT
jgi:cell fate regulator YaaT (PSP1 superfamily)